MRFELRKYNDLILHQKEMRRISYENSDERNFKYHMEIQSLMGLYEIIEFCFNSNHCSGEYCASSKDSRRYFNFITGESFPLHIEYAFGNIYSWCIFRSAFDGVGSLCGNSIRYANNGSVGKRDCAEIQKAGLQLL